MRKGFFLRNILDNSKNMSTFAIAFEGRHEDC